MPVSPTEIRDWTIYKLTNPEGQNYIGCTSVFKSRMSAYRTLGGKCHKQRLLYASLVQFGLHGHELQILDKFTNTKTYSEDKEMFWVRSFMCNRNKWPEINGLNLSDGGGGSPGMVLTEERKRQIGDINRGVPMSEEQKKKLSDYGKSNPSMGFLGKHHTEENKKILSALKKEKPSNFKGKTHSEDYKKWASESRKGKPNLKAKGKKLWSEEDKKRIGLSKIGNKNMLGKKMPKECVDKMRLNMQRKFGKPVIMYSLEGIFLQEFPSINEAKKYSKMSETSIREILNGVIKNPKQFIFKYNPK